MVYEPIYHNENKVIELLKDLTNILGAFSIKQLFHSCLLDMRSALRACLAIYFTNRFHVAVHLFSNIITDDVKML